MKKINLLPVKQPMDVLKWITGVTLFGIAVGTLFFSLKPWFTSKFFRDKTLRSTAFHSGALLNQYSINQLRMVGSLKKTHTDGTEYYWALIQSPNTQVISLKVGDRVGNQASRVIAITSQATHFQSDQKDAPLVILTKKGT